MKSRSWIVLSAGFGTLILLIALLGTGAMRRARAQQSETVAAHQAYMETSAAIEEISSELYWTAILVRDYLLDPSPRMDAHYRGQLLARRDRIRQQLDSLSRHLGGSEPQRLAELNEKVNDYWDSIEPILDWSAAEKSALSWAFLRGQVLPRREAVLALAREIGEINTANLRREQLVLRSSQESFERFLRRMLAVAVAIGLLVALASIARVVTLERRAEREHRRSERAEEEMRCLSRSLVRTQEDERRSLSRELHDAIGQMLAAMTLEIGNMEAAIDKPDRLRERLEEARRLNAGTINGVRNLAMALRPAMLDELGLGPALRWLGREFERRSGVRVDILVDGDLDRLPEAHRTCIFRIVQEALNNCAKHAHAKSIRISLYGGTDSIRLSVQDDGVGFDASTAPANGLGLIGIQERVRERNGTLAISSQPGKGSIVEVELPIEIGAAIG